MGYGGKTVNGLSYLGPKMGGKAHGGGVKIEKGMGKISQSQDDVLSGEETKMENDSMGSTKMISGGHSKGKFMSTPRYKQGYNDRQDESLSAKDGKESSKSQTMKDRRDEREGENKALGNKPDGFAKYDEPKKLVGGQKELIKKAPKLAKAIDDATGGGGMTRYGSHKKPKK